MGVIACVNMASTLPILMSEDDTNRFKNKAAIDDAIPKAYTTVLHWACKKTPEETYLQYLVRIRTPQYMEKRWGTTDKQRIEHAEIDSIKCDVTLLNKLIRACVELDRADKITKQRADTLINYLKELTNIRNAVVHNPKTDAISPDILQRIATETERLFTAAEELYSLGKDVVMRELDNIKTMLQGIDKKGMTEKQAVLTEIANSLCIEGKKETNEIADRQAKVILPFSDLEVPRKNIFHRCKLKAVKNKTEDVEVGASPAENKEESKPVSSEQLFTSPSLESNNLTIIGEPGSGKSTLLKALREDFVSVKEKETFPEIRKFELLLFMECRKDIKTVAKLIKHNFPKTLQKIKADDAIEAMLLRKILICIDGIDELHPCSEKLLRNLIDTFGRHEGVMFIFTSRPGATRWLEETLFDEGISHIVLALQPLTDESEQIEFLDRYSHTLPDPHASDLKGTFLSLDESCKIHLIQPIHLALFCFLYHTSPSDIRKWKNELSIMKKTLNLSKELIRKRLKQEGLKNCENLADELIEKMENVSLRQIKENRMTLQLKDCTKLCQDLFGKSNVSYYTVLSCLIVGQPDHQTFEYLHKSQAEFLAASAVLTELVQKKASIHSIINNTQSGSSSHVTTTRTDVTEQGIANRFSNVFRFVLMDLIDMGLNDTVRRCLDEFCPALVEEKMPLEYWLELTASCLSSEDVAKTAAKAAKTASWGTWPLSSPRHMAAAIRILPHHQPRRLTITSSQSGGVSHVLSPLLKEVSQRFTGRLWLQLFNSYSEGTPVDDLLKILCRPLVDVSPTSSKCRLEQFRGCLNPGGQQSLALLVKQAGDGVLLHVHLLHPRQHQLARLGTVKGFLAVRASLTKCYARQRSPLPTGAFFPPALTVVCSTGTGQDDVSGLIEDLAPPQDMRHINMRASQMTLDDEIRRPMSVTNEKFIYESDEMIAKEYTYDPGYGGKWLLFIPLDKMDSMWRISCQLYRQRQFRGITSIKSSTAMHNPRQSTIKQGVICFHCGPSDNEACMKRYGENIIKKLGFANETGYISYKSEEQSNLGTRASGRTKNSLYKIEVPKLRCSAAQASPEVRCHPSKPSPQKGKASRGGQYRWLRLQHWHGTDDELHQLVSALNDAKVRTMDSGSPRWSLAGSDSRELCEVCEEGSHRPGDGRCVRILLSESQ